MTLNVTMEMGGTVLELPPWSPYNRDTYSLFTGMVPSLEKQNQLLPHDLVAEKQQQQLFSK